jgi:transposase
VDPVLTKEGFFLSRVAVAQLTLVDIFRFRIWAWFSYFISMQGKKQYQEKLFVNFQLSEHIPQDNFYRRLKEAIDFSFLYKRTSTYYGAEGQKSIDPVVFMKLMLVGYLENINSDRRIVATAQMRLDILYFLGYNIDEELPWHSTLSRSRQLYGEEVFKEVFQLVLKQCIERGMVAGRRQSLDSVLIKANASMESMVEREVYRDAEEFTKELNESAEQIRKTPVVKLPRKAHKKGLPAKTNPTNKTHYSPSDPDAKMATKPGKPMALSYLGQVCVDTASHVITHVKAFQADKRDSQCLPQMVEDLQSNLAQSGIKTEELLADAAYSSGEALKALEAHNITGYIPNRGQFVAERPGFVYDQQGDYYTCPNNQKLSHKGTFQTLPGVYNKEYRISKKLCNVCSLKDQCTALKNKRNGACITETVDREYYLRMHQRMLTRRAKRLMRERSATVEPVIGTLVNHLALKKVYTKGVKGASKCMLLSAAAYNIKKLLKHTSLLVQVKTAQVTKELKNTLQRLSSALEWLLHLNKATLAIDRQSVL